MIIESLCADDTFAFGKKLGEAAEPGTVYTLVGDLGVGKTVLTQGLAEGLGITEAVNSPTFTILQVYEEGRLPLYHFDVYRIGDVEEMDEIGYEDYFYGDGVCLIEWASQIRDILPDDCHQVTIAKDLDRVFEGSDIAGFNSNKFDVPLLSEEFYRAGVQFDVSKRKMVDIQTIFHKMEQRTLVAAYKFYCGKNLEEAHSANADTRATYEVLKAQLDRYPTLENDVDFLAKYSSQNRNVDLAGRIVLNDQDVEVFNFGKYKGQPVETVLKKDSGYFGWILQGDFAQNTKSVLTNIKLRMK